MFAYCANNPIIYVDESGREYRLVGAGVQVDVSAGLATMGVEIICYWGTDECKNGGIVIAVYAYGGASINMNDAWIGSIIAIITDNSKYLESNYGTALLAILAMLGDGFSFSVSGLAVFGNEKFTSTEDYTGSFTTVGVGWGKARGSYSYSENCRTVSVGGNLIGSQLLPSWGVSKTHYWQVGKVCIGGKQTSTRSVVRNKLLGGGRTSLCHRVCLMV